MAFLVVCTTHANDVSTFLLANSFPTPFRFNKDVETKL